MNGVIYVRVSSSEQVEGTSLAVQEEQCRRYCKERCIAVLEVFREEGESAKTADRTELLRALAFCRLAKRQVKAFVVAKVDRFARNTEDHFYIRQHLQKAGVTLYSVSEPIGNSPTEKFVETVLAAGAEFDNAIRRQRSLDGMSGRIRQGIYPWKPPVGYLCAGHRQRQEKKTRPDEPHPVLFPLIQRAFREYLSGELRTLSDFSRALNLWGYAKVVGRKAGPQLADRLLGRHLDFYSGRLVNPWDGMVYQGGHQAILSQKEADTIRLIRAGRLKPWAMRKSRNNPEFPLRRLMRCAECGRNFTGAFSRSGTRTYPYYFCPNRTCSLRGKSIPRDKLHASFLSLLEKITPAPRAWRILAQSLRTSFTEREITQTAANTAFEARLRELEEKRAKLFALREDGSYSKETFLERLSAVEADIALQKVSNSAPTPVNASIDTLIRKAKDFHLTLSGQWQCQTDLSRDRFERFVFPAGIVYDRRYGVRTPQLGPLLAVTWRLRELNYAWVPLKGNRSNADLLNCLLRFGEEQEHPRHDPTKK